MHDKMMKMLGKKRDLSEHEKNAKMDVMKEMRDEAANAMHGKLDGIKKVSVLSDSDEGLAKGLDKAKEIASPGYSEGGQISDMEMEGMREDAEDPYEDVENAHREHESDEGEGMPEHEAEESPAEEAEEHPEMSHEEIDAAISKLQELKKLKK